MTASRLSAMLEGVPINGNVGLLALCPRVMDGTEVLYLVSARVKYFYAKDGGNRVNEQQLVMDSAVPGMWFT